MQVRYGIGEWFGRDISAMTTGDRRLAAQAALRQQAKNQNNIPLCPFKQPLQPGSLCTKPGGVCSIRRYENEDGNVTFGDEQPVTVCPNRFRERLGDGTHVFSVIGDLLWGDQHPLVVKEVPFLKKRANDEGGAKAGRIDWVVLPGDAADQDDPRWAAVETQALYFSGDNMWLDIDDYHAHPESLRFPAGKRRPDYRSSGPKRLSPQLDVKAPRIGRWGRNTVVVIDRYFWDQMPGLDTTTVPDIDNAEVIWVVFKYDANMHMVFDLAVGASMVQSRDVLSGTDPMNKPEFTANLLSLLNDEDSEKVFRT